MENENLDEVPNVEEYEDSINESFKQYGISYERGKTDVSQRLGRSYMTNTQNHLPDTNQSQYVSEIEDSIIDL